MQYNKKYGGISISNQGETLDVYDLRILKVLEDNAELPLNEIGKKVGILSASAVSKRISRLKEDGYIERVTAKLNYEKLGFNFSTMTLMRAKYRKNYADVLGKKLAMMPDIVSVYNTLGDADFLVCTINRNKDEFTKSLERILAISDIERSDTKTVIKTFKEMDYSGVRLFEDDKT